ncbi:hypothetical protein Lal_00026816 [Lupinus albus]|nr:hypothetical protein Lal_00026816 [Lupinus albus]
MARVPFLAPRSPPETGASTEWQFFSAAAAAISTASEGSDVVMSTRIPPGRRPERAPEEDRTNIGRVANDGENDVGLRSESLRGLGLVGPHVEEGLGFRRSAVEDGEGVASSDEMGAHGLAHHSGTDPAQAGI